VWKTLFTPMFGPQYWHFVVAMLLTAGYMVAGVYAVGWLRGRRDHYHRLGFAVPFTIAAVATPVQFVLGDAIARSVFHKQPVKFAAMEIVWKTDTRVPEYIFGRLHPDGTISGGIKIPLLDSFLAGFSPNTKVVGLTSVPAGERPTATQATIAHWAFDIMVLIGSVLVLLALLVRPGLATTPPASRLEVVLSQRGLRGRRLRRDRRMRLTSTRSTTLWITLGLVIVVYVFIFGSLLGVLLKMRTRWRLADEQWAAGHPAHAPEADSPYGPRAPVPAGDATSGSGTGAPEDGRP
jgi:cytochrome d ubiquinol oxidase subunit I